MAIEISEQWLSQQTEDVQAVIRMLLAHIKKQDERIAELEARLGLNPRNSSRPPSTQHPHAKSPAEKPKSPRKQGGQKGRNKSQRELIPSEQVDKVVTCLPPACRRCGRDLGGEDAAPLRHQVFELPEFQPRVTEYQQHRLRCSKCGITTCGALPEGVPTHSAGPRLTAFVSLLMAHYRQSKQRTALFLESILNIPASPGWICKLQTQATAALRPAYEQLAGQLPRQPRLGIDETPMKQAGQNTWLWSFVAEEFTLFQIRPNRSGKILADLLTAEFSGVVTCDRAKMYFQLKSLQWCWAHLKRDFQKMSEATDPQAAQIGQQLLRQTGKLFAAIYRCRDGTLSESGFQIAMGRIRQQTAALLLRGLRLSHQKTAGTCRELFWHRENLWRFVSDRRIPATNNHSERSLRNPVIWRKLSFGTQSDSGNRFVETLLSVLETCRQQGRNALAYLTSTLTAAFASQTIPKLLSGV